MTLAILASLILWPAYVAVALLLQLVGLVILLPLAALNWWQAGESHIWPERKHPLNIDYWCPPVPYLHWLFWLWGNEEDGVTGPEWWKVRTGVASPFRLVAPWHVQAWSAYRWSALRNPVNNMRFVPWINPVIEPAGIRSRTWNPIDKPWLVVLTWQGPYAGLRIHCHGWRFWLGWKLKPEDARGVPDTDMRKPRCGFAMQCKRVWP